MADNITTTCCIAGGGPAGMMAGFLLARAGIDVYVLEKHKDFFRDFRGDTIHPSTFQLMHELGILDEFLKVPHQELKEIGAQFNKQFIKIADFSHLPVAKPVAGFMPQWDFLNFLQKQACNYPGFHLLMQTEAVDLMKDGNKVIGIKAETPEGTKEIFSTIVILADGRDSKLREKTGLVPANFGVPIDVLWFRLSKHLTDPVQSLGYFQKGRLMVLLDRSEYWQCGYIIPKGGFSEIRQRGLPAFYKEISAIVPFLEERAKEITDWDQVKLLTVAVNRLSKWYIDGLICIGDAAHAMSPVGGVGINLALQDAVAAANILYSPLQMSTKSDVDFTKYFKKIQKRRMYPTKVIQKLQLMIQKGLIGKTSAKDAVAKPPFFLRLFNRWALLRRIPAKLIGMGVRPEHIRIPEKNK